MKKKVYIILIFVSIVGLNVFGKSSCCEKMSLVDRYVGLRVVKNEKTKTNETKQMYLRVCSSCCSYHKTVYKMN